MGLEPNASVEIEIGDGGTGFAVVDADPESLQSVIANHPNAVVGISQHPDGAIINVAGGIVGETTTVTYYTEAAEDNTEPESDEPVKPAEHKAEAEASAQSNPKPPEAKSEDAEKAKPAKP